LNIAYDGNLLSLPLLNFVEGLSGKVGKDGAIAPENFSIGGENGDIKALLYFDYLNMQKESDGSIFQMDFTSDVLLKIK